MKNPFLVLGSIVLCTILVPVFISVIAYNDVNVEYKYDAPAQVNIEARGTATYKGVPITFPVVHKTIFAVLPSYIGYLEDYNYLPFAFLDDKTGATRELEYYLENKNNEFFKKVF